MRRGAHVGLGRTPCPRRFGRPLEPSPVGRSPIVAVSQCLRILPLGYYTRGLDLPSPFGGFTRRDGRLRSGVSPSCINERRQGMATLAELHLGVGDGQQVHLDGLMRLGGTAIPAPNGQQHYFSSSGEYWDTWSTTSGRCSSSTASRCSSPRRMAPTAWPWPIKGWRCGPASSTKTRTACTTRPTTVRMLRTSSNSIAIPTTMETPATTAPRRRTRHSKIGMATAAATTVTFASTRPTRSKQTTTRTHAAMPATIVLASPIPHKAISTATMLATPGTRRRGATTRSATWTAATRAARATRRLAATATRVAWARHPMAATAIGPGSEGPRPTDRAETRRVWRQVRPRSQKEETTPTAAPRPKMTAAAAAARARRAYDPARLSVAEASSQGCRSRFSAAQLSVTADTVLAGWAAHAAGRGAAAPLGALTATSQLRAAGLHVTGHSFARK